MNWIIILVTLLLIVVLAAFTAYFSVCQLYYQIKDLRIVRNIQLALIMMLSWVGLNQPMGIAHMCYYWNNYQYWDLAYHIISSIQYIVAMLLCWPFLNDIVYKFQVHMLTVDEEGYDTDTAEYRVFLSNVPDKISFLLCIVSIILFVL